MAKYFEGSVLLAYCGICVFCIIWGTIRRQRAERKTFVLFSLMLCVWGYFAIKITQFPVFITEGMEEALGGNMWASINLNPLKGLFSLSSMANIVMTIPFGFLYPILCRKKMSKVQVCFMCLLPGIIIEVGQLIQLLVIGYTLRVVDINDIIFNSIGAFVGYMGFRFLKNRERGRR